jgi:RNase P/RNase MRP subunit p29
MSRFEQLENAFDLPRLEDSLVDKIDATQALESAEDLEQDFKQRDHFELHDQEMDEIANLAVEYGKTLHDLGLNVEIRNAGEIFNASSNMLKIAVDARNLKVEKKLKLLKLELDRLKLDRSLPDPGETAEREHVTVLDRNALLAQIKTLTNVSAK